MWKVRLHLHFIFLSSYIYVNLEHILISSVQIQLCRSHVGFLLTSTVRNQASPCPPCTLGFRLGTRPLHPHPMCMLISSFTLLGSPHTSCPIALLELWLPLTLGSLLLPNMDDLLMPAWALASILEGPNAYTCSSPSASLTPCVGIPSHGYPLILPVLQHPRPSCAVCEYPSTPLRFWLPTPGCSLSRCLPHPVGLYILCQAFPQRGRCPFIGTPSLPRPGSDISHWAVTSMNIYFTLPT